MLRMDMIPSGAHLEELGYGAKHDQLKLDHQQHQQTNATFKGNTGRTQDNVEQLKSMLNRKYQCYTNFEEVDDEVIRFLRQKCNGNPSLVLAVFH